MTQFLHVSQLEFQTNIFKGHIQCKTKSQGMIVWAKLSNFNKLP